MRAWGATDRSVPAVVRAHVQSALEKILEVRKQRRIARFRTWAAAADFATEEVTHEPQQDEPREPANSAHIVLSPAKSAGAPYSLRLSSRDRLRC